MTEKQIVERMAQAIYECHQFVKPWDHRDTARVWQHTCRREAQAAFNVMKQVALDVSEPNVSAHIG